MSIENKIDDYEEEAIERLEAFIESLMGDKKFVIPVDEYEDGPVEDHWAYVYTSRGSRLIERMIDRLYKLARSKFGEDAAFDMEISTTMYQEM